MLNIIHSLAKDMGPTINILEDDKFKRLRCNVDNAMKERTANGLQKPVRQAQIISVSMEMELFQKKYWVMMILKSCSIQFIFLLINSWLFVLGRNTEIYVLGHSHKFKLLEWEQKKRLSIMKQYRKITKVAGVIPKNGGNLSYWRVVLPSKNHQKVYIVSSNRFQKFLFSPPSTVQKRYLVSKFSRWENTSNGIIKPLASKAGWDASLHSSGHSLRASTVSTLVEQNVTSWKLERSLVIEKLLD